MSHYREFGYVVVNDDFDTACAELESILAGSGQALASDRPALEPLLTDLLGAP
jgi:guanylate kinase